MAVSMVDLWSVVMVVVAVIMVRTLPMLCIVKEMKAVGLNPDCNIEHDIKKRR